MEHDPANGSQVVVLAELPHSRRRVVVFGSAGKRRVGVSVGDIVAFGVGFANPVAWAYLGLKKVYQAHAPSGHPDALVVSLDTVDERLAFPPGHPTEGIAYCASPSSPDRYVPMAQFHDIVAREKAVEFFRLLAALRVDTASLDWAMSDTVTSGASPEGLVPAQVPVKLAAAAGAVVKTTSQTSYRATFDGRGEPHVPKDLLWYEHEPEWRQLAEGRLLHGLKDFTIAYSHTDDYGITVGLAASFEEHEISLGGTFHRLREQRWIVKGSFRSKPLWGW